MADPCVCVVGTCVTPSRVVYDVYGVHVVIYVDDGVGDVYVVVVAPLW